MPAVKCLPVLHHNAFFFFFFFFFFHFLWDHWAHCGILKIVLLMYMLVGVSSVANFISAYEVSIKPRHPFSVSNVFYVFKGNLFYFYCIETWTSSNTDQIRLFTRPPVRFVLAWICRCPLPSSVGKGCGL